VELDGKGGRRYRMGGGTGADVDVNPCSSGTLESFVR
jgi:hypothetical protein